MTIALVATACSGMDAGDVADDKLDDTGVPVIDIEVGESLADLHVAKGELAVFRMHLEAGETFAAVMRAETEGLDSYLLLKGPSKATLRKRDDQTVLPMAPQSDSVLVWTATESGTYILFGAGGADLDTDGNFRLDLFALSSPPPAEIDSTGPAQRAFHDELSRLEPDVARFIEVGALFEGPDGFLVRDVEQFKTLPLAERAQLASVETAVNSDREQLFEFVPAPASLAELWIAVRR